MQKVVRKYDSVILGGRFDHDHVEKEDRAIERHAPRQTCKQKAVAEPCERPNKLITRSLNRSNIASILYNTSSWPRKSYENICANVPAKLSAKAPLLCAQVYDKRKRNSQKK